MAMPPPSITAYATSRPGLGGPHQKSSGSMTVLPEQKERSHQSDVGGIEDVRAPIPDQVFGEQRCRRNPGEEVPPVPRPVVTPGLPHDPQDQGNPATGEHGACRPDDLPALDEGPHQFDEGACEDGGEDLRHRHCETERRLAEHMDGDDHPGEVQAGIPNAG